MSTNRDVGIRVAVAGEPDGQDVESCQHCSERTTRPS